MNIALVVKSLRESANETQSELATAIGMFAGYISLIERGIKTPSEKTLKLIGAHYGVPVPFILWRATELTDLPEDNRPLFIALNPSITDLMNQVLK